MIHLCMLAWRRAVPYLLVTAAADQSCGGEFCAHCIQGALHSGWQAFSHFSGCEVTCIGHALLVRWC